MYFSQFLKKFFKIVEKFLKVPMNCLFLRKAQKINARFLKFSEKSPYIMHFRNFLKKFLGRIFLKVFPPPEKNPGPL